MIPCLTISTISVLWYSQHECSRFHCPRTRVKRWIHLSKLLTAKQRLRKEDSTAYLGGKSYPPNITTTVGKMKTSRVDEDFRSQWGPSLWLSDGILPSPESGGILQRIYFMRFRVAVRKRRLGGAQRRPFILGLPLTLVPIYFTTYQQTLEISEHAVSFAVITCPDYLKRLADW